VISRFRVPLVPVKKVQSNQRQKIDGIVATVGNYIVLDSDIDNQKFQVKVGQ
jgi:peptidyl-prolyl cis-trans isomerase SurA